MAGLNRQYRIGLVVIALLLLAAIVVIAEIGQHRQQVINTRIRVAQQRELILAELPSTLANAETAQRTYLLTDEQQYLRSYQALRARVGPGLVQLDDLFRQDDPALSPAQHRSARQLRTLAVAKLGELDTSLTLYSAEGSAQAVALLRSDFGRPTMAQIRSEAMQLREAERVAVGAALAREDRLRIVSRLLMATAVLLNVALLILASTLLTRQARRRAEQTRQLAAENLELERRVSERTTELSALSSHLQQLSENEKASLARELHDELGGLLIAVKMDIAWLRKRWADGDPGAQSRFSRVLKALDDGVDFKRRVVENLRPTLLDNMGLFPALRWVMQETNSRAGLRYTEQYPEHEPQLTDAAAITLFRLVQESLTNIVKHANATEVQLSVALENENLLLNLTDNGGGIAPGRSHAIGSHGIATMRHRVRGLGGELTITAAAAGGTRVHARIPQAAILRAPGGAAG